MGFGCSEVQGSGFRGSGFWVQRFRGSEVQRFIRGSKVQRFKVEVQRFKVQRFRVQRCPWPKKRPKKKKKKLLELGSEIGCCWVSHFAKAPS